MENSGAWITLSARYGVKGAGLHTVQQGIELCFAPLMTEPSRSGGAMTVPDVASNLERTTAYPTAAACLEALSPEAINWFVSYECQQGSVRVNSQIGGLISEIQVSLAGWEARVPAYTTAFTEFSNVTGLTRAVNQPLSMPASMRGERRSYYSEKTITKQWFQSCLAILAQYEGNGSRFSGQIRAKGPEYNDNDLESWTREVDAQWDDLKMITYWRMDGQASQWVSIDFDAQGVMLALWSTPELAGRQGLRFEDFVAPLQLFAAEGDLNQGYRFARTYRKKEKVRSWKEEDDGRAATAIEASIKAAFGEERYTVQSAGFVEGGVAERQVSFSTLEGFLARLRNDDPYQIADLILRGPRGNFLEFVLKPKLCSVVVKGVLVVNSSTDRATLIDKRIYAFTQPFRDKDLELELIDSEDPVRPEADAAAAKPAAKASAIAPWIPAIGSVVLAVVGFLLGSNGLQSLKPTLEITVPLSAATGKVAVTGNEMPLRWVVTSKQLFHGEETKDTPATIVVQQQGPPYHAHEYSGQQSGRQLLTFEGPGTYVVTVRVQTDGSAHERSFEATVAP